MKGEDHCIPALGAKEKESESDSLQTSLDTARAVALGKAVWFPENADCG